MGRLVMTNVVTVLCTCPDQAEAEKLAGGLLENGLAACVNIMPEIRSIYRWQGVLNNDGESLMIIKTSRQKYSSVQSWLERHHPYDVPEIIALPVEQGSGAYLDWVVNETSATGPDNDRQ